MLEKPDIADEKIIECMRAEFDRRLTEFAFLPLGGDLSSALYRGMANDGTPYFIKLRRGEFDETTVELPKFLSAQGIHEIIPPLETNTGLLRADFGEWKVILYPFIEGKNGYEVALTEPQWREFGAAMRKIHDVTLPPELTRTIEKETYSTEWRDSTTNLVERVMTETFTDPIMAEGAAFLRERADRALALVARAGELAEQMKARDAKFGLCHGDIHGGNLLITPHGPVYIVDWDYPVLAPRERDLMFIGGGQGFLADSAEQEEELFYRGYGDAEIDWLALTYYRYERAVMDITVEGERILSDALTARDRAQSLEYFKWEWLPGFQIDRAYKADERLRAYSHDLDAE